MDRLSVVISAYNEEERLPACLHSVSFADEIIVIDNESSDRTAAIAKRSKAKVYTRPNNLMLNMSKNFGFSKATGDWILNLDADEQVTPDLETEIKGVLANPPKDIVGFAIPRKNIIFGKWMQHTGWYPDYQLRFFRKGKGKFAEQHVHEQIAVEGRVDCLDHALLHENYQSVHQFLHKLFTIYAPNEAENILRQETGNEEKAGLWSPYTFRWQDAVTASFREFAQRFYVQKGYKDGVHGLMLSILMAFYHFVVYTYVWEKEKFVDENRSVLKDSADFEIQKELRYWKLTADIEEEQNGLKKNYLRLKRRVS